jgi:hypothetical protein
MVVSVLKGVGVFTVSVFFLAVLMFLTQPHNTATGIGVFKSQVPMLFVIGALYIGLGLYLWFGL